MNNNEKQESVNNRTMDDTDRTDIDVGESSSSGESRRSRRSGNDFGLAERLTDILVEDGDGDLLLQNSDREDRFMQWLQALDMQVMGACRADERLKPLLKLNVSNGGVAEDCLLSHLSQHFDPSEVAMLARCLCIPLVSIRVGKINKQGALLHPTSTRGNLTLTLLPTSNLRISFIGDDAQVERLATFSSSTSLSSVEIEEIPADRSGRSFVIRITGCENHYFWCSEKSKLLGDELINKLKDWLFKKPSLADLTGISESRLEHFVTQLRSYIGGSTGAKTQTASSVSVTISSDTLDSHYAVSSTKCSRPRYYGSQGGRPSAYYQGSLSPRSSSFKEGLPKNLSTFKSVSREKFRRRGENLLLVVDNLPPSPKNSDEFIANSSKNKLHEYKENISSPFSSFLDTLVKPTDGPLRTSSASQPVCSPLISPYYCWCPPVASTLQYAVAPLQLPISSESFSLPPLSSLLSTSMPSSVLTPKAPLNLSEIRTLDFPPFLSEPLVGLPLSMPTSQKIATFTPLMCDPIVHVPFIDICSSGPGYLVSAGPSISTAVPSMNPTLVNPLIPSSDSMVENTARETLRLLLSSSSQNNSQLIPGLPSVLTNNTENRRILAATGNRGVYDGATDVGVIAHSIAAMSMVSLSEMPVGSSGVPNRCHTKRDMVDQLEKPRVSGGNCLEEESGSSFSNLGKEREGGMID